MIKPEHIFKSKASLGSPYLEKTHYKKGLLEWLKVKP
jgi:hypothetical protein